MINLCPRIILWWTVPQFQGHLAHFGGKKTPITWNIRILKLWTQHKLTLFWNPFLGGLSVIIFVAMTCGIYRLCRREGPDYRAANGHPHYSVAISNSLFKEGRYKIFYYPFLFYNNRSRSQTNFKAYFPVQCTKD